MSKRKAQPNVMPKKESNTMTIKVGKVSVGHQGNTHQVHDNRPKRSRTRQAQRSAWQKEFV
tara:strand:+ start:1983 stop:2165 length:183 start_codon:yes stop_codon:yes gene_type:complete